MVKSITYATFASNLAGTGNEQVYAHDKELGTIIMVLQPGSAQNFHLVLFDREV